ncbi:hypothetical protein Gpo141_00009106 [Globisporangium polare]
MAEDHAARILLCSDHFHVLQLVSHDARGRPQLVDVTQVRRRYKELAILVHPDKSKSADAEEAFKRLSVAYECLSDESSQRSYLRTLVTTLRSAHSAPKRPPPPPSSAPPKTGPAPYPRKKKQKKSKSDKQQPPPASRDPSSGFQPPPPSAPRRQRTAEEIWKQFQEEEERMARKEFMSKGFERAYANASFGSRDAATDDGFEKASVNMAVQESILSSDLSAKAYNWSSWKKNASSPTPAPDPSTNHPVNEGASEQRGPMATEPEKELICCLLCRRKFPTHEALSRHKSYSELHLTNLQRSQAN